MTTEDALWIAERIIEEKTQPGNNEEIGQLHLPGSEPYGYEPDRMIRDDEEHTIEQDIAPIQYKLAESKQAAQRAREASEYADQTRLEAELFEAWVSEQQAQGRHDRLTFGDFVRETGALLPKGVVA